MSDKGQEARGKLLPCPFCGGEAVLEHGTEYAPWFEVDCPNCDAEGPTRPTEAEAIEAWNRRSERTAKPKKGAYDLIRCDCGMPVSSNYDFCPRCKAKLDWSEL